MCVIYTSIHECECVYTYKHMYLDSMLCESFFSFVHSVPGRAHFTRSLGMTNDIDSNEQMSSKGVFLLHKYRIHKYSQKCRT